MNSTESARTLARFGEAEGGPGEKKYNSCAWFVFVIASIFGVGLVLLVVPNVLQRFSFTSRTEAMVGILEIKGALESYAVANGGVFPESLEVLLETGSDGRQFLRSSDALRDPWGRKYLYEPPTPEHAEPRILSYGRDGEPGGEGEDEDLDSLKFRYKH
jgi:general secretion pathway protein G